jgi:signal peptidase II
MKITKGKALIILGVVLLVIDQVIKVLVKTNMSIGESIHVFNWFQIFFIENEGMAYGMKFGGAVGKFCLSLFRVVLSGVLIWWISKLLKRSDVPTGALVGLTLITAGAMGNIIDCLFYGMIWDYAPFMFGRVVDMFYFPLIETVWPTWMPFVGGEKYIFFAPVFNFADSCVTCGAIYLLLFQWKFFSAEEDRIIEKR